MNDTGLVLGALLMLAGLAGGVSAAWEFWPNWLPWRWRRSWRP